MISDKLGADAIKPPKGAAVVTNSIGGLLGGIGGLLGGIGGGKPSTAASSSPSLRPGVSTSTVNTASLTQTAGAQVRTLPSYHTHKSGVPFH